MKNKLFGIIAIISVIAFPACGSGGGDGLIKVAKPALTVSKFGYNGSEHTVTLNQTNEAYTLSGEITKTELGDYAATVTLEDTDTHKWADGTTAPLSLSWSITHPGEAFVLPSYIPGFIRNCVRGLPIIPTQTSSSTVFDGRWYISIGAYIIIWTQKSYTLPDTCNQAFYFIPDANGDYFQIKSSYNTLTPCVIALEGDIAAEGMRLIFKEQDITDDSQWWKLLSQPDGSFNIQSKTNPALFIAPMSVIPADSDPNPHNYLTMQPLGTANNTWIFDLIGWGW